MFKIYKTIGVIADSYTVVNEEGCILLDDTDPSMPMTYSGDSEEEAREFFETHKEFTNRNISHELDPYNEWCQDVEYHFVSNI